MVVKEEVTLILNEGCSNMKSGKAYGGRDIVFQHRHRQVPFTF